jgi:hypothetical protein
MGTRDWLDGCSIDVQGKGKGEERTSTILSLTVISRHTWF